MPFVCNDRQFVFIGTVTINHQVEYVFDFLCNMLNWSIWNLLVQYAQTSNYIFIQPSETSHLFRPQVSLY